MSDIAIKVEGLSKAYRLGTLDEKPETLVQVVMDLVRHPLRNLRRLKRLNTFNTELESSDILWALKNISFEIKQGEVVGFVGRNGAGKSTLLKVLSRITDPTAGRIMIRGRVSSLLEVGTGFHPELTGRDNVYMNGTILGMKKKEIDRKFDEIVDFSGVERFLDTPVKRYSSGMKVRLAFAVAAHLEPELLIVDEVLAVGDAEFQKKCLGKMQDVAGHGRTVLFVSHNMGAVQSLCSRAIALRNGQMTDDGASSDVVRRYLSSMTTHRQDVFSLDNPDRSGSGEARIRFCCVIDSKGQITDNVISGMPISLRFFYEINKDIDDLMIAFTIYNQLGIAVTHINNELHEFRVRPFNQCGVVTCLLPRNPFPLGEYRIAAALYYHGKKLDHLPVAAVFSVMDSVFFGTKVPLGSYCTAYVDHDWIVEEVSQMTDFVEQDKTRLGERHAPII